MEMIRRKTSIVGENADDDSSSDGSNTSSLSLIIDEQESIVGLSRQLLDMGIHIVEKLPRNTIDYIIEEVEDDYGVAEITGRTGRVCKDVDGRYVFQRRSTDSSVKDILKDGEWHEPNEFTNFQLRFMEFNFYTYTERDNFMSGDCEVAVISAAGSTGISLHSDSRCANTKQRVQIVLELPWSADSAIQQVKCVFISIIYIIYLLILL